MWACGSIRKRVESSARFRARTASVISSAFPRRTPQHSRGWHSFACADDRVDDRRSNRHRAVCLQRFDRHCDAHSAADAERGDAVPKTSRLERVQQRGENPCAACTDWMAERNGAAVDVHLRRIHAKLSHDRQRLRSERFVQLKEIDCRSLEAGALEDFPHRGNRADAHDHRIDAGHRVGEHSRQRLNASLPSRSRDSSRRARPRRR